MARPRGTKKDREQAVRMVTGAKKLIGYVRVSTEGQGENGHSLDSQRTRLHEVADREGFQVVTVIEEVASGRKDRDGLREAQARVDAGEAEGLVFTKLDRLGRGLVGMGHLLTWATEHSVTLLSVNEGMVAQGGEVVNEAAEVLVGLAAWQARYISKRTKEGLAAAKAKGIRLGHAPTNTDLQGRATRLRRKGKTLQWIADKFNSEGKLTAGGRPYMATTVWRMVNRVDPSANPEGGSGKRTKKATGGKP